MIHKAIAVAVILQICLSQLTVGQLLTFKDGRVGVNFGGYHASAGLGGGANGGFLSADAGTPYGQSAKAGLGGRTDQNGRLGGNLYAGATGGRGLTAAAGLGGELENSDTPRAIGSIYADAQSGRGKAEAGLHGKRVGGENAVADGEIYSNSRSPGGYAAEDGLQGRVGGGAPPSGVIRTKTVVPKEDGSVYIEKVKTSAPAGGVRNRFNDGERHEEDKRPINKDGEDDSNSEAENINKNEYGELPPLDILFPEKGEIIYDKIKTQIHDSDHSRNEGDEGPQIVEKVYKPENKKYNLPPFDSVFPEVDETLDSTKKKVATSDDDLQERLSKVDKKLKNQGELDKPEIDDQLPPLDAAFPEADYQIEAYETKEDKDSKSKTNLKGRTEGDALRSDTVNTENDKIGMFPQRKESAKPVVVENERDEKPIEQRLSNLEAIFKKLLGNGLPVPEKNDAVEFGGLNQRKGESDERDAVSIEERINALEASLKEILEEEITPLVSSNPKNVDKTEEERTEIEDEYGVEPKMKQRINSELPEYTKNTEPDKRVNDFRQRFNQNYPSKVEDEPVVDEKLYGPEPDLNTMLEGVLHSLDTLIENTNIQNPIDTSIHVSNSKEIYKGGERPVVEDEFYRPFEAREPPRGVIRTETSVPDSDINVYNIEKTKSVVPSGGRQRYNNDQNEVLNGGNPQYPNDQQDNFYTYRKTVQVGGGASPQDNLEPTITYLRPHHLHHHLKHRLRAPIRKTVILESSPSSVPSYEVYGAESSDVPTATRFDKTVRVGGGGTFFDDIFNIPISSLRAVNGLLTNGVNRGFEIQKTIQTGNQGIESRPAPAQGVSAGATFDSRYGGGDGTFLGDIFNIPISTLKAVNGFLTNNVPKRTVSVDKTVRSYQ